MTKTAWLISRVVIEDLDRKTSLSTVHVSLRIHNFHATSVVGILFKYFALRSPLSQSEQWAGRGGVAHRHARFLVGRTPKWLVTYTVCEGIRGDYKLLHARLNKARYVSSWERFWIQSLGLLKKRRRFVVFLRRYMQILKRIKMILSSLRINSCTRLEINKEQVEFKGSLSGVKNNLFHKMFFFLGKKSIASLFCCYNKTLRENSTKLYLVTGMLSSVSIFCTFIM